MVNMRNNALRMVYTALLAIHNEIAMSQGVSWVCSPVCSFEATPEKKGQLAAA